MKRNSILRVCMRGSLIMAVAFALASCGYMHNVYLRGEVTDISGQTLPGVVVLVLGTEYSALTNAVGCYSFGAAQGTLHLEFIKTGYTPARLEVTVDALGVTEVPTVALWPLPIGEGVYLFQEYRYAQTNHPRPNRYKVKDAGNAFGTPVTPELVIPWADPETHPELNPPFLIGHKMPAYDARMHKLRRAEAALIHGRATPQSDDLQYNEEVWIAESAVPLRSRTLDEPGKLLVALTPALPLVPGVYAIHWGALDGYDSIEPRIFLFSVEAPEEEDSEHETEDTESPDETEQTE